MPGFELRVATEFNVVKVKISKEVQTRVDQLLAANRCLGCEEPIVDGERERRGLCSTCHSGVMNALRKGLKTEKELMEAGNLLPKDPGGRKPANKFTASLTGRESEVA